MAPALKTVTVEAVAGMPCHQDEVEIRDAVVMISDVVAICQTGAEDVMINIDRHLIKGREILRIIDRLHNPHINNRRPIDHRRSHQFIGRNHRFTDPLQIVIARYNLHTVDHPFDM